MLPNRRYHSLLSDCSSLTRVAGSSPTPFSSLDPSLPRLVRHWQAGCESSSCCGLGALLGAGLGALLGGDAARLTFVRERAGSDAYSQQAARERTGGGGWCGGGVYGNGQWGWSVVRAGAR